MAETLNIAFFRSTIRKSLQQRMLMLVNVMGFFSIIILLFLVHIITNPVEPDYFATSINGQTSKIDALDMPNQSDHTIVEFANLAAIAAYNYNFYNAQASLDDARKYFTTRGWQQFSLAVQQSNILAETQAKGLIVSAVAVEPPVILAKGSLYGQYSWRVQLLILITYNASGGTQSFGPLPVTMLINRISTLDSVQGIGISEFNVGTQILGSLQ